MATERLYPEGLMGKKLGMTQVFNTEGECIPVTVIRLGPNFVLDVRTQAADGYSAVQLGFEPKKASRVNKAEQGHFNKAGKGTFYHVKEVRCPVEALGWGALGQELRVADVFKDGEKVDVTGVTIGRGFQGVVRRFKSKGQPASRGTHEFERHIGSVGCRKTPARIYKNKRMPGHMGNVRVTVQNLDVISVKGDENLLLVRGAVPGPRGALVLVKKAMKGYQTPVKAA